MAEVVWYLFSAGGAIVLVSLAAVWFLASSRSTTARRVLVAVILFYWVAGTDVVGDSFRRILGYGFQPLTRSDVPSGRVAVVLLGSGSLRFRDWSDNEIALVDPIGASRLLEAARVFRLLNADVLLSSGGLAKETDRIRPSGQTMADALISLGIPKDRLLVETRSRTTREEAVVVREMLQTQRVDHVVLVTSQFHMRRSAGAFRAVGIDVIPAVAREPAGFDTWWEMLVPTDKGLKDSAMAAHEVLGLALYAVRGWYRS